MEELNPGNRYRPVAICAGQSIAFAFVAALMIQAPTASAQSSQNIFVIPLTDDPVIDAGDDDLSAELKALSAPTNASGVAGNATAIVIAAPPLNAPAAVGPMEHATGRDRQVNDPTLDNIQTFPGARPLENATESETSVGMDSNHIVVGYNSSARTRVVELGGGQLAYTQRLFSAYSVSHDGGATWKSSFIPPLSPGAAFTGGDPSVAVDRDGNFWYSHLARDGNNQPGIGIAKSTDHGETFSPAMVYIDPNVDKDWLAIGPDPIDPRHDNLYVTWIRNGIQVMLSKSLDGGTTWTTDAVYTPPLLPPVPIPQLSRRVQFSNPVVDRSNGHLYIPFLQFSNFGPDVIRVLESDDGGFTFKLLAFNVSGAADAFSYPVVEPGVIGSCDNGGARVVLHQGNSVSAASPSYAFATRIITQPAAAARNGSFLFAFNVSTSGTFGDPAAGSEIHLLASNDGGNTWEAPVTIAASTADDPQHVHPAVAFAEEGQKLLVTYYVQQSDTRLRTDVASLVHETDGWHVTDTEQLSTRTFDLTPSNNVLGTGVHTNFDRTVAACYDIGEYMSIATSGKHAFAAWGDNRNTWTGPADSSAPGPHAKADVFFRRLDAGQAPDGQVSE